MQRKHGKNEDRLIEDKGRKMNCLDNFAIDFIAFWCKSEKLEAFEDKEFKVHFITLAKTEIFQTFRQRERERDVLTLTV
jgi:hypothetical protein